MFLTDQQVAQRYAVSRATIWRWGKVDPTFPKAVSLSPGCVRWRVSDLEGWESARAAREGGPDHAEPAPAAAAPQPAPVAPRRRGARG